MAKKTDASQAKGTAPKAPGKMPAIDYLLFLPPIASALFLWYMYAFTKAECICEWNRSGFAASTIVALCMIGLQEGLTYFMFRRGAKRPVMYAIYAVMLIVAFFVHIAVMRMFLSAMT